jgi:hypothetical protein
VRWRSNDLPHLTIDARRGMTASLIFGIIHITYALADTGCHASELQGSRGRRKKEAKKKKVTRTRICTEILGFLLLL